MNSRKRCALERNLKYCKTHIGHSIVYGDNLSGVVEDVVLIGDALLIKLKGEPFATVYVDAVRLCSCGN